MPQSVDKVNQSKASRPARPAEALRAPELLEQLHALMHRVKRHLSRTLRELPGGLTPMEWRALDFFHRHPGAPARDLVRHSGRDKAQVARLVRGLVERGLLAAGVSDGDQRSQPLSLTDAGQAVADALAAERRRLERRLAGGLSADERAQFAALLQRAHQALGEP